MKLNDLKSNTVTENMSQHTDVASEMEKIADHWKENGKGMSEEDLMDAIGNDLEQLEYSPEEIEQLLPKVVAMVMR